MSEDGIVKKQRPEYIEGPEAAERFQKAMKGILAVPHDVIKKRIEEHREASAQNPNRRGPKPKASRAKSK